MTRKTKNNAIHLIPEYILRTYWGIIFCVASSFVTPVNSLAQCPIQDSLWSRLIFLRDSKPPPKAEDQLTELLQFEKNIQSCNYKNDSTHALLLQRIGVMYYQLGNFKNSISYTLSSVAINSQNSKSGRTKYTDNLRNYFNLTNIYTKAGNNVEKMKAVDSCIAISKRYSIVNGYYLAALVKRSEFNFYSGDYARCINDVTVYKNICLDYAFNKGPQYLEEGLGYALQCNTWKINALIFTKDFESAELSLQDDIKNFSRSLNKGRLGTIYSLLGDVAVAKGEHAKGISFYRIASKIDLQYNDLRGGCTALEKIGFVYYDKFQNYDSAKFYYNSAIKYSDPTELLNIYDNIANVYVRLQKFDSAFNYFQKGFDQISPGINEKNLLENAPDLVTANITEYVTGLVLDKAEAYSSQYKIKGNKTYLLSALQIYLVADKLFDIIRNTQSELSSQLFWRSHIRRLYENAIEASYSINDIFTSFHFCERSRAMILNDQLTRQKWMKPDEILAQSNLKKKQNQLLKSLETVSQDSKEYKTLQTELYDTRQELDRLEMNIKLHNPLYYQNYIDTSSVEISTIQNQLLDKYQALIEIYYGESTVYLIVVQKNAAKITRIERREFDSLSNLFIKYVSSKEIQNAHFENFVQHSRSLFNLLFATNQIPDGRLIISPDGKYFPFEALSSGDSSGRPRYLIQQSAISYTYSAKFLLNNFKSEEDKASRNFLGVAPVQFPPKFNLPVLQESDQSINRISNFFSGSQSLLNSHATVNEFLNSFGNFSIVQLYTHAADSGFNEEPIIYFSDSVLNVSDLILERRPGTKVIVLSACESGLGINYAGEGVFSLSRAFAALGVPTSISNLWSVETGNTYKISELFYKELSKGTPPDIALQKAKINFLESSNGSDRLPFSWAAPILTGKADSVILHSASYMYLVIAGGILVVVIGALFYRYFKHKNNRDHPRFNGSDN